MKLQISHFILFAVGTSLGNRITCNVPDGKPSSIPQDCQVCLDTIVVTNDKSTWPTKKLALQEITKTLSVQADLPDFLQIPLQVETLEITGYISDESEFLDIQAKNLYLNQLYDTSITFNDIKPSVLKIKSSKVTIDGISSEHLARLDINYATIKNTRLRNLKSIGALNIYSSTIFPQQLFNNLEEAHSINIRYSKINQLKMYVEKVTGSINIEDNKNMESIEFPFLKYVHGDLFIDNFSDISLVHMPQLQHIHAIEIYDETSRINLPSEATWQGESFFEATSSLENYIDFKERGLKFGLGLRYNTRCAIGLEI